MIVAVLLNMGCSEKTVVECVCTPFPSGDSAVLKVGKKINIYDCCNDKLFISLKQVEDSRCPSQLQCVWAGTAHIKIHLNQTFGGLIDLELGKSKTVNYNNHTYTFKFSNLSPYPVNSYPNQEDYEATVIISRE